MKAKIVIMLLSLLLFGCGAVAKHNSQGNAHYYSGDYEAALRSYQQAQVAEPDEAESYFNAASALVAQGDAGDAVDALKQALRTADDELAANAFYNLGNVYYETERYGQAVEAYKQALIRRPDDQQARYNLELALLNALEPTPTAQEQQTSPDMGETDPETTPTDQPGGFEGPTPTPPPQELEPSATPESGESPGGVDDSATPVPQPGGDMTAEQAERLLDQIQQEQQALMEFLQQVGSGGQPLEPDW
jgi:tetratricopeptide (TPR) repeat protein